MPTILVTGASSGIGKSTAILFAKNGFRVFGTSRRKLSDESGIEMLELDVRSDDSIHQCVKRVLTRAGGIDVLVNNAGVWQVGIAEETSMEDVRAIFEINFFGVVRMTNAVLPSMRNRRQGRIINVGSLSAWVGEPGEAFYAASKRALAAYTETLHQEVWPLGIHASLVEPGAFKTNLMPTPTTEHTAIPDYDGIRNASRKILLRALQEGGDPRRVAELVLKVARFRAPRLRYGVGSGANWIPYFKVLSPQSVFDYAIRRAFGLRPIS